MRSGMKSDFRKFRLYKRLAIVFMLVALVVGCDGAKEKAESIGIIGGEDGRVQALYGAVVKNGMCRDAGEAYVDPSEYTN